MPTNEECFAKAQEYDRLARECPTDSAKELFWQMATTWRRFAKAREVERMPPKAGPGPLTARPS